MGQLHFEFPRSAGLVTLSKYTPVKFTKALGPDELHPRVLKELATELGPVFVHLFQQSLDMGACKYRPVSLTCVPCKLLEHIVCSNIMAHLD